MDRRIAQDTIAIRSQLRQAEALGDETLLATAELMKRMLVARSNPDVVPHEGQQALVRLVRAQAQIVDGTSNLFRVHNELSKLGIARGLMDEEGSTPQSAELDDAVPTRAEMPALAG